MINVDTLKTELLSCVGWRQNPDPNGHQLIGLTTSDSFLYFNDEHPLLTFDNLYSVAPDFDLYTYPTHDIKDFSIAVGTVVDDGSGNLYELILTLIDEQPLTNETYWIPFDPFTKWLQEKTESGIIQAINDWFSKKSGLYTANNLINTGKLLTGNDRIGNNYTILEAGKTYGLEILKHETLSSNLLKIGLHFDQEITMDVFLYEEGVKDAKEFHNLHYQNGGLEWFNVNWTFNDEKRHYLVFEGQGQKAYYIEDPKVMKYAECRSFHLDQSVSELWDVQDNIYSSRNYGINAYMNLQCDYTDFIVDQKDLFKVAISKKVAMMLLREFAFNPNALVNRNVQNIKYESMVYEIDGASEATPGNNVTLRAQYDEAIMAIQFDRSGIDKICLPCRKRGVKYRTIR